MAETYKQEGGQFHLWVHHTKLDEAGKPVLDKKGNPIREEEQRLSETLDPSDPNRERIIYHSSTEVGVAYCQLPDRLHVFTHGIAEGMRKWVEVHNSHSPHKASLKIFDQRTSVDVLNRAIRDSEFFASLIR